MPRCASTSSTKLIESKPLLGIESCTPRAAEHKILTFIQCNGEKPCSTCRKRMQERLCSYEASHIRLPDDPPPPDGKSSPICQCIRKFNVPDVGDKTSHHPEPNTISDPISKTPFAPIQGMSLHTRNSSHPITAPPHLMAETHNWSSPHMPFPQAVAPTPAIIKLIPGQELPLSSMAYMPPSAFSPPQSLWQNPGQVITDYIQPDRNLLSRNGPMIATKSSSHRSVKSKGQQLSVIQHPTIPRGRQQVAPTTLSPMLEKSPKKNMRRSSKSPHVGKRESCYRSPWSVCRLTHVFKLFGVILQTLHY